MKTWDVEEAQDRFEEVMRLARETEPQRVGRDDREAVVVISAAEYNRLAAPSQNLFEFLQASPLARAIAEDGIEFEIERSPN